MGKPVLKTTPGREWEMEQKTDAPKDFMRDYKAAGKLEGKRAIVTGGDSGIGRAVAIGFAKEGADVAVFYLEEDRDAEVTKQQVEQTGRQCFLIRGDIGDAAFCRDAVEKAVKQLGGLDILVNNAAEQYSKESLLEISDEQLESTFRTNIFSMFYLTRAALPHLKKGASIINTTSITAYQGSAHLLDYSSTKGAITSFTRSLAANLAEKGIRVNGVAPGPIVTPLNPPLMDKKEWAEFGKDTPMKRPGQPDEVAPCFIFLASADASYMSGQILHPNGGEVVNA